MAPKQFVIRFVFTCFLLISLSGLFNRIVDPFWYYRDTEIKGFNEVKPKFSSFSRQIKPGLLIRNQPEAIIFGSSYSEIGFDPTNIVFTDHGQLKSMNFAFAGASWNNVQCAFEFAVTHTNVKRALIGFLPGNLPVANCEEKSSTFVDIKPIELLLSSTVLNASMRTVLNQHKHAATHTREGMFFYNRELRPDIPARFSIVLRRQLPCNQSNNAGRGLDSKKLDLGGLQRMIRTANEHKIELVLFAYPLHAYNFELDEQCAKSSARWQAMKQISSLVEAESAKRTKAVRVWQFFGYNAQTAEPADATAKYWQDPEHFNFEMGDLMLSDMFGETLNKPKFGHSLTAGSNEADYREFFQERLEYLQHHPEFQADLQKLLHTK